MTGVFGSCGAEGGTLSAAPDSGNTSQVQQMSDPRARAEATVRAYYDAFNRGDVEGFLALLTEDVVHDCGPWPR